MRGTSEELQGFVVDAEGLVDHRKDIAVVTQDASPVYLDMSTGKVLVKESFLDERRNRVRRNRVPVESWL